jgi:catechol 2,3-dioxygenase-like lactoylglutathione lyase family enzyme
MFKTFDTAILYVNDIKRAKDFYINTLGLRVRQ